MTTGELAAGTLRTPADSAGVTAMAQAEHHRSVPHFPARALRAVFRSGLVLAAFAGLLALVAPAVWRVDPASDSVPRALLGFGVLLCEVFAFHGGLALGVVGSVALLARNRRLGAIILALAGVHAGPGLVAMLGPQDKAFARGEISDPTLTVLSHNLLYSRAGLDTLGAIIQREQPDAIMLQEVVGDRAGEILHRFGEAYPHIVWPNTHRWGGMLLSRHPFVEVPDALSGQDGWRIDQPVGTIAFDGAPVTLMGVHLPAPNRLRQLVAGPQMSERLAQWVKEREGESLVLAGDFNAPLTTTRMTMLREAGLMRAHEAAGAGRGATWPARTPLRHAPGIRLDQVAFKGGLRCVESRVLDATGSDHRPVLARFVRTD